ncbi:MAG: prolyl oligopeptidase family serine peptidase [Nitrospirae bacterium]|nr:prolyl oligopeptidase family serine peptidase [Nitrospirota bacterium]
MICRRTTDGAACNMARGYQESVSVAGAGFMPADDVRRKPILLEAIGKTITAAALLVGCSIDSPSPLKYESPGPYPVGNAHFEVTDAARSRTFWVEVWYPAVGSARAGASVGEPAEQFLVPGADHDTYAGLLRAAPQPGPTLVKHSATDAEADTSTAPWPLVLFSHCMSCTRFSSFSLAERLASHGIAVAAPDHTGGTLFDSLKGSAAFLTPDFLETRARDMEFLLDVLVDADSAEVPAALRGRFDSSRVGIFGHSFGGATAGLVLNQDSRFKAGLAIAVPMENPLLPGPTMAVIRVPVLFLLAKEDNMVYEIGNTYIRKNFDTANQPAWKVEVADAGHMSFSDICKVTDRYPAGCGEGERQTKPGEKFTYLDPAIARSIGQAYVTAFFSAHLKGEPAGLDFLSAPRPEALVEVRSR